MSPPNILGRATRCGNGPIYGSWFYEPIKIYQAKLVRKLDPYQIVELLRSAFDAVDGSHYRHRDVPDLGVIPVPLRSAIGYKYHKLRIPRIGNTWG